MKTTFKLDLLKKDKTILTIDLLKDVTEFDGNIIKFKKVEKDNKVSFETDVNLSKDYLGYSFVYDYYFNELIDECEFFSPSAYYGNIHNPTKLFFANNISGAGVDIISAPVMCFYFKGYGYVLRDLTPGRRDTCGADACIQEGIKYLVGDYFRLPGLGVRSEDDRVVLEYRYPAQTYNNIEPNRNLYRFLNSKSASFSFDLRKIESPSFNEFWVSIWREEFNRRELIKNNINTYEALQCIIDNVCEGYGFRNSNPEFMINTDHFTRESGFLYRNCDLAQLLIQAKMMGFNVSLSYDQLIGVIDNQVINEYAGRNMMWPFARSRVEGMYAIFAAYKLLKELKITKDSWYEYILNEAELILDTDDYFEIPFLCELYKYTKNDKYLSSAVRKGQLVWDNKLSKNNFSGGITDFIGAAPLDKETGLLNLTSYIELYEVTNDKKYLEYAKRCADYAETYSQLTNINLEPHDYDDTNNYGQMGHGNSHVNSQSLSYVSNTCGTADPGNLFTVYDFVKLADYTKDEHYREFAYFAYINAFNIVSLDDKTGGMDDYLFCTKHGFAPEYIALAGSIDGACNGRGRMHDSNLGWVMYGFLHSGLEFVNDKRFKDYRNEKRYKIISVSSVESGKSELSNVNLITGGRRTFFDIGKAGFAKLNFFNNTLVDKVVISFTDPSVEATYKISYLEDNRAVVLGSYKHTKGFYDVIPLDINLDSLIITFNKKDNLYISGIIPFGLTTNKLNCYADNTSDNFTKRYVKDDVNYFVNNETIKFDDRIGTYCGDHCEFLRGGHVRICDREASCKFKLDSNKTIFWFRKSLIETCEKDVTVKLLLNDEQKLFALIENTTIYSTVLGSGDVEIIFNSPNARNSIEFGYLEIKELNLYD